jgi:hypothetical protein
MARTVLDSQRKTKLSGLLIEHWGERHLMVAVKIGSIVEIAVFQCNCSYHAS